MHTSDNPNTSIGSDASCRSFSVNFPKTKSLLGSELFPGKTEGCTFTPLKT